MVSTNTEEKPTEKVELFISTGKPVAKAKAKPKSVVNSSSNSVPFNERKWTDIDTQPFDHSCFEVSKFMTRTLRHESSIPREEDGGIRFDDLIDKIKEDFVSTLQWTVKTWANSLAKGGKKKKRVPYCSNPYSSIEFLYFCATQGLSGDNFVHRVHLPHRERLRDALHYSKWTDPRKKKQQKGQTVSVLAVNNLDIQPDQREVEYDNRTVHTWRSHHNTVFLCN